MPQTATEIKPTATELWEALNEAKRVRDAAAAVLAYDVTFRADEPYVGQHQRRSDALTAQLKANYRAACAAVDAAYGAWDARNEADF